VSIAKLRKGDTGSCEFYSRGFGYNASIAEGSAETTKARLYAHEGLANVK
jgi:hypothetical protein